MFFSDTRQGLILFILVALLSLSLHAHSSVTPEPVAVSTNPLLSALVEGQRQGEIYAELGDYDLVDIYLIDSELNNADEDRREIRADEISRIVKDYKNRFPNYNFISGLYVDFIQMSKDNNDEPSFKTIDQYLYSYDETFNQSSTGCRHLNQDDLNGIWRGEKPFPSENRIQVWTNERRSDHTFEITFYENDTGKVEAVEIGRWSLNGCILKNTITDINDEAGIFVEKYHINELSDTTIDYTSFTSKKRYQMYKDSK